MDRAFSLCACVFTRVLKGKRPELLTPKSVEMWSTAGPRHALNLDVKRVKMGGKRGSAYQYDCTFLSLLTETRKPR